MIDFSVATCLLTRTTRVLFIIVRRKERRRRNMLGVNISFILGSKSGEGEGEKKLPVKSFFFFLSTQRSSREVYLSCRQLSAVCVFKIVDRWTVLEKLSRKKQRVSGIWTSLPCLRWFDFRLEPIFCSTAPPQKNIGHIKSGHKRQKNNYLATFTKTQSISLIYTVQLLAVVFKKKV